MTLSSSSLTTAAFLLLLWLDTFRVLPPLEDLCEFLIGILPPLNENSSYRWDPISSFAFISIISLVWDDYTDGAKTTSAFWRNGLSYYGCTCSFSGRSSSLESSFPKSRSAFSSIFTSNYGTETSSTLYFGGESEFFLIFFDGSC
jgi:hypothetical protein